MANDLPLQSARQVDVPRERVPWLPIALTTVAVALGPTCIITTISAMLIRGLPIASWTATERPGILVIAVTRWEVRLPPVVIAIAVVGGATVPAIRCVSVPLIIARVVIARVEIHIGALR